MHNFLILPVSAVPEWTKQNVPTYPLARFSNDGQFMLLDDAHPETTYRKWLGPNADQLDAVMSAAVRVTAEEFNILENDPGSIWSGGEVE
jgi:hypothetical protein